ncbi:MAG: S1 RNA-binding domain-containing protein [Candidatus Magasanikbacteria bacterium]|jgi:small subunit ribosomal protein S1|nr:S1 RNA-binding domain-containing protein [Candidatus Magasanikbacteria bacterium]MBT4071429.1 S1 RNA-binding domain-containing protein [Candidatus Magasanikbacteria bacterium]
MVTKNQENFEDLLQDYFAKLPKVGETIKGKVISVSNGAVRIDVNGLLIGIIRSRELFAESSEYSNIQVGTEVEATVIEQENETGEMELSFRIAGYQRVWDNMAQHVVDGVAIDAKIIHANKGGLMVQLDALTGFMPVSQLAPEHYPRVQGGDKNRILEHLQQLVGISLKVKVLDANQKEEKLILSEKAVWEDDQKAVLESYKIGDLVSGEVSALTSFGAFMKFGEGLEGLIHISEIVWQRIDHPKDILKVGDKVEAQIIDLNKSKIYLSMKRLVDDPWKKVKDMYKVGQIVSGEVHKIEPFGLMVKLDNHIHGLAHISELSNKQISNVTELRTIFTIGESKDFEIINIEPAEHRLGLRLAGVKPKREEKKEDKPVSAKAAPDKTVSDEVVSDKKEEKVEEVVEEKVEKTEEKSA